MGKRVKITVADMHLDRLESFPEDDEPLIVVAKVASRGMADIEAVIPLPLWAIREIACWYTRWIGVVTPETATCPGKAA